MDDIPPLLVDVSAQPSIDDIEPVPVTVVTGYLGSGKTTLLQYLATHSTKKIAVVLNEFGNTSDIEKSLVVRNTSSDVDVEEWIELDNGCMCCTAKAAGVTAIEKLIVNSVKRGKKIDHVIVETSGLANPANVATMFWLDSALMAKVKLNGIVTVVDARTFAKSQAESSLAGVQVALADLVVINKCDTLKSESEKQELVDLVRGISGLTEIATCEYGKVDCDLILDLNASPDSNKIDGYTKQDSHSEHGLATAHIDLSELETRPYDFEKLERKIQHLLWENEINGNSLEIYRTKGRIQLPREKKTKIVQAVREVYEIVDVPYEPEADFKLVFIGKNTKMLESEIQKYLLDV